MCVSRWVAVLWHVVKTSHLNAWLSGWVKNCVCVCSRWVAVLWHVVKTSHLNAHSFCASTGAWQKAAPICG